MVRTLRAFVLLLGLAVALRAGTSLENALRAQAMLGDDVWSEVIKVRNETRGGPYPGILHALVFELGGVLWFYTDVDGTQSFSLYQGQAEREKAEMGPLLREIDPGFVRWTIVQGKSHQPATPEAPLPNGCFIESVVALREKVAHGTRLQNPRLLSYYQNTAGGQRGHTVLAYEIGERVEIFDAGRSNKHFVFDRRLGRDPLGLARALDGCEVIKARYFPLEAAKGTTVASHTSAPRSQRTSRGT